MERIYFQNKPVFITNHAIKQTRRRKMTAEHINHIIRTGKVTRFGKHFLKFTGKSVICIGQDLGRIILIKTVERKSP